MANRAVEIDLRAVDSDVPTTAVVRVEPGDVIDVPEDITNSTGVYGGLLDQPDKWQRVTPTKAAKPAGKEQD